MCGKTYARARSVKPNPLRVKRSVQTVRGRAHKTAGTIAEAGFGNDRSSRIGHSKNAIRWRREGSPPGRFATGYARGETRGLDTGAWRLHSHDKHVTEARSTLVTRAFQTARCPSMHPEREVSGPLFFEEKGRFFCAVFPPAADVVLALVTYPQLFLP